MRFIRKKKTVLLAVGIMLLSLTACSGEEFSSAEMSNDTCMEDIKVTLENAELIFDYEEELQYATRFTLTHYKGGYSMFSIPGISAERQYLIVPNGKEVPSQLSEDTIVLQQPITNICFASGSMASLTEAIGAEDCITTVAIERDGWALDSVAAGMDSGAISYSGSFRNPDFELLLSKGVQLEIDTTMLLNYPEIMEKYDKMGIPYFIEDSTKEESPLGRMEWVKLLGAILGREEETSAYFKEQVVKIEALKAMENTGKTVALFYIGEKSVYVRNGGDYIPAMLIMAGGNYCMGNINPNQGGNAKVSFEEFYSSCKDADYLFWVILSCPYDTLEELIASNELFADFKAVQNGTVYSSRRGFAQRTADFADVILEMNDILNNPEIEETDTFVKLK